MTAELDPTRAYRILGLAPGAAAAEVKAAYRDLVQVWHPDRFPADSRLRAKAERNLQRINAAYELLKDAPTVPVAPPGHFGSRLRESVVDLFGIGDVRESAVFQAPRRALRQSLHVLGLDPSLGRHAGGGGPSGSPQGCRHRDRSGRGACGARGSGLGRLAKALTTRSRLCSVVPMLL